MQVLTLGMWLKEFKKLSSEYLLNIGTAVFEDGDIGQAADDLQLEAYQNVQARLGNDEDSISDWVDYDASCDARVDFKYELESKVNENAELE